MTDIKHHSHEISDHPEIQWALDLLKPDPNYEPSVLQKYMNEICFMTLGFAVPCVRNFYSFRPWYSGFQAHGIATALGYFVAQGVNVIIDTYRADRDTKLRDYIIRHPELFPEPERKKYGEILHPWMPVR